MTTWIRSDYSQTTLLLTGKVEIYLDEGKNSKRSHVWDSTGQMINFDFIEPITIETSPLKDGPK